MSSTFAAVLVATSVFASPGEASTQSPPTIAAPAGAAQADDMFEGRVILSTKAMLTIVAKNGDNVSFAISSSCKITRDGKQSNAEMIAPGDRVVIASSMDGDRRVANSITARGAEKPANAGLAMSESAR